LRTIITGSRNTNNGIETLTLLECDRRTKIENLKLLACVQEGDTIVTTEVSRITRSTKQLCDIIDLCKEKHLKLVIKDSITIDCYSDSGMEAMSEAFLMMAGVFAQLERNMTVTRNRVFINAKAKGVKLGRPEITIKDLPKKVIDNFDKYKYGIITKVDFCKICGISRPTLDKYIAILTDK